MKDMLFDVPIQKTRLEIVMEKYGIETLDSDASMGNARWMAYLMPACRNLGYGVTETSDIVDVMMKVCRLVDEAGYSGYGATEMEAVLDVCRNNQIMVCL